MNYCLHLTKVEQSQSIKHMRYCHLALLVHPEHLQLRSPEHELLSTSSGTSSALAPLAYQGSAIKKCKTQTHTHVAVYNQRCQFCSGTVGLQSFCNDKIPNTLITAPAVPVLQWHRWLTKVLQSRNLKHTRCCLPPAVPVLPWHLWLTKVLQRQNSKHTCCCLHPAAPVTPWRRWLTKVLQ
jgi:hypothetical protein